MPLPQKKERNKCIVALFICGVGKRTISRETHTGYRNCYHFIDKYLPKYQEEILENVEKFKLQLKKGKAQASSK